MAVPGAREETAFRTLKADGLGLDRPPLRMSMP